MKEMNIVRCFNNEWVSAVWWKCCRLSDDWSASYQHFATGDSHLGGSWSNWLATMTPSSDSFPPHNNTKKEDFVGMCKMCMSLLLPHHLTISRTHQWCRCPRHVWFLCWCCRQHVCFLGWYCCWHADCWSLDTAAPAATTATTTTTTYASAIDTVLPPPDDCCRLGCCCPPTSMNAFSFSGF